MNPLIVLSLIGAAVIVLSRVSTAGAASSLNFVIDSVKPSFSNVFTVVIDITILIQNPTSTSFTINSLSGNVFLNDDYLGNVSNFTATLIRANSQTPYTVTVMISTLALPGTVIDMIKDFRGFVITLDATANVDQLTIPVNITYTAPL